LDTLRDAPDHAVGVILATPEALIHTAYLERGLEQLARRHRLSHVAVDEARTTKFRDVAFSHLAHVKAIGAQYGVPLQLLFQDVARSTPPKN